MVGVRILPGQETLRFPKRADLPWGTPSFVMKVYSGVQWPELEADHEILPNTEKGMCGSIVWLHFTPDTRQYGFHFYLLTPCGTALLEHLTGSQLVKKFPAFYGTRRFITAFTSARHLSLSWASSMLSIPPNPTSWRSNLTEEKEPTRCHLLFYCTFYRFNMFRALLCPSSGAYDYKVDHHTGRLVL